LAKAESSSPAQRHESVARQKANSKFRKGSIRTAVPLVEDPRGGDCAALLGKLVRDAVAGGPFFGSIAPFEKALHVL
jgi:hypothetical protein